MGWFDIELLAPNKRLIQRIRQPNILHWEGSEDLIKRFFLGGSSKDFIMGFCGAMLTSRFHRPNKTTFEINQDFETTFADLTHAAANEGGVPDDDSRTCVGYERKSLNWSFRQDGSHWAVESGWQTWTHAITWAFHGVWYEWNSTTSEWDEIEKGLWEQWPNREYWAPIHGFPWDVPNIHENYLMGGEFVDLPPGSGGGYPSPDARGEWYAGNLHRLGGYPITTFWVATDDEKLVASTVLRAPMLWRPGHTIRCRYSARLHGKAPHPRVIDLDWV